jgi:hypothetical protein
VEHTKKFVAVPRIEEARVDIPNGGTRRYRASVHAFELGCVVRQAEVAVIERQKFGRVCQKVSEKRFVGTWNIA